MSHIYVDMDGTLLDGSLDSKITKETIMETTALRLLTASSDVMRTIRQIVTNSTMRQAFKSQYAVYLINLARTNNLL